MVKSGVLLTNNLFFGRLDFTLLRLVYINDFDEGAHATSIEHDAKLWDLVVAVLTDPILNFGMRADIL